VKLYLDILDQPRQALLRELEFLKPRFYLAGGTALALRIGHRDSLDFDFFCADRFQVEGLHMQLKAKLSGHEVIVTQSDSDTLGVLVDGSVRLSLCSTPINCLQNLSTPTP